jgi:hypothetical protein
LSEEDGWAEGGEEEGTGGEGEGEREEVQGEERLRAL